MKKIAVIGGDLREKVLIRSLARQGHRLMVLGDKMLDHENIYFSRDLGEVLDGVDAVIAPMSSTDKEGYLKATFIPDKIKLDREFFALIPEKTLFLIGIAIPKIKRFFNKCCEI